MATSPRKHVESVVLALIGIASVLPMRFSNESRGWLLAECTALLVLFVTPKVISHLVSKQVQAQRLVNLAIGLVAITPIVFAILARRFGTPIAFEISALSTFGSFALSLAMASNAPRTRAMSIVASGFLVLFATSISDDSGAVLIAIAWMAICVWHLVANHWEKLEVCMPDEIRRNIGVRPASVLAAIVLCVLAGLLARDRFVDSSRFTIGVMPSSGGSKWSDPAARSGIGTGDAAIAAKDHAESFGAVESDLFLESTESSLFDMVNDMIGEPKKKNIWERRQAVGNENLIPTHDTVAKSEQGGSSFSTDRFPPKKHQHLEDHEETAVIQWTGATGIRLAMHRYDQFDGVEWTNSADHAQHRLNRQTTEKQVWFFDPTLHRRAMADDDSVSVNLLKVLRLDSTRIPAPMLTAGLHVKDVDRQDFFALDDDGSLFMPGREKVPSMTVVNLASMGLTEDELWKGLEKQSLSPLGVHDQQLETFVTALNSRSDHPYSKLQSIVSHLRNEFILDRSFGGDRAKDGSETRLSPEDTTPISEFLRSRRGGDHLFASTAALMARSIGLQSRLVTGFYVRPDSFDLSAGHANITPNDVHVWVEIKLEDGRWFEIEPTPGFREPVYAPSLLLVAKRFAAAYWPVGLAIFAAGCLLYATRLLWIESLLTLAWLASRPSCGRRQISLVVRIIETRAKLIGRPRPTGTPQRDWLESMVDRDVDLCCCIKRFCDIADHVVFGASKQVDRKQLGSVVRALKIKQLKLANQDHPA